MLHPAVQPGATLDYEPKIEKTTVRFGAWEKTAESRAGQWLPFDVSFTTGKDEAAPVLTWSTDRDPRPRALPLRRILLPWARPHAEPTALITEREVPEVQGGNWLRGRTLYFGKALCATCHTMRGEGGQVGPDLGNLTQRDYASVVRDIREPSAALNPDHIAYLIEPKDGDAFTAVSVGENRYADAAGKIHELPKSAIKSTQALAISLMPPALLDALTPAEQRDLLTFLLLPPMEPAPIQAPNPPPPRRKACRASCSEPRASRAARAWGYAVTREIRTLLQPFVVTGSQVTTAANLDGSTTLSWPGYGYDWRFIVESSPDLTTWQPVEPASQWPSYVTTFTFTPSAGVPQLFYRVRAVPAALP